MNYFKKLKNLIILIFAILSFGVFANFANAASDGVVVYVNYVVSVSASGGGTVSPGSAVVASGGSTSFSVTPNSNYYVSSASGCGGSLSGSTYYTGAISSNCTVSINFAVKPYLTVNTAGNGTGSVGGAGYYNYGSTGTASASAGTGSYFAGWGGDCNSSGQVTMNGNKTCTATFYLNTYGLSVTVGGNGSGTVTSNQGGISCPGDCSESYNYNTPVTLSGSPSTGSYLSAWGGDCNTSGQVTMGGSRSCTATFTLNTYYLTVNKTGNGGGTVTGAGTYNYGTGVTATATADGNSVFTGWSGDCDSNGYVVMNAGKTCSANFVARSDITGLSVSPNPVPLTGATTVSYSCANGYYSHLLLDWKWSSEGGWDYSGYYGSVSVATPALNTSGSHTMSAYCYNSSWTPSTDSWYSIGFTVSAPTTPSGFGVGASSQGNNWLNLWWNASAGATSYQVYRNGSTLVYDGAGTSFSDTGLTFGATYSYTIKATNNGVSSALSGSINGTVANAPNPTTDLKVSAWSGSNLDGSTETYGGDTYTLSWPAISNASSCTLDGSGVAVSGGSTTRTASNRSATHTLTCTNSTGQSVSDSVTVTTPPVPTGYYFGCSPDAMTATAYWTAPSGYNTFYTRATRRSDGAYVLNNDGATGTSNSFSIAPNTNYDYWMHTRNPSNGAWSYSTGGLINCPRYGTLIYYAGTGGSVSGTTTQTIPYGGSGTQVTAVPASGYTFSSWSDGVTSASRTDTNVTESKTVTANFVDSTPPSAPGSLTTSWTRDHFVNGAFTASTSGASDSGTGIRGYWLCRSPDNTGGCYYEVAGGEQASTSRTVSGGDLPSPGTYRYYYWYARDNAGNQSTNSPDVYIRMDGVSPVYNSTWFEGCNYESGNNCYVKNGTTFYTFVSHSDNSPGVQSGTNTQYFELSKNGENRGTWDSATGNIKSYAVPYGVGYGGYYTSYGEGMVNDTYMNIVDAQCVQSGDCNSTAVGKWKVVAGSGPSTMYGVTVYMYDGMWNGVGYTATPKYVYLDNGTPSVPDPSDDGYSVSGSTLNFYSSPSDDSSGVSTCYAQVDVNNADGLSLAMGTTDVGSDGDHSISGSAGNTYYYRYYCTDRVGNSSGWSAWSNGVAINVAPSISSPAHSSVSLTSATLGATITSAGIPASITERGTCWGTSGSPTTNCAAEGGTAVSAFSHSRGGLSPSTTYYYRGYATNASGTTYSADGSFTTGAVTISGVSATTSYNTTVGASVSFAYTTPTTNISSVQCQLLDNSSNALTSYSTANPIVYTAPSSPGSFGYYIRCRNATYTGTTSTSSLITVNIPSPTGSISASPSSCTISIGGSSCSTTISWSTTNPVNTSTVISGGSTLYTANSGSQSVSVPYSSRTFTLHNNGTQIGTTTPTSSCATGSTWNGSTCGINSYTVSTSVGAGGSVSPTSASVAHGSTTSFTISPDAGYSIGSASGCGGTRSGNTYTTGAITSACTISVGFSLNYYTVSVSAGANGTVTPSSRSVPHGSTTTFNIVPNAGYSVSASGCGGSLNGQTYTTGAVTSACTISVSYSQLSYSLNYSAGAGGSISGSSSQVVNYGSNASTVTAVPNTGYHFTGWSEGGLHKFTSGSSTFTPPSGVNNVELLVVAGGGGGGSSSYGNGGGGGGGAGGLKYYSSYSVTPGSPVNITVGAGGISGELGEAQSGVKGGNSSFGSTVVTGGGYGAGPGADGGSGGSGGGAGYNGYSSVRSGGSNVSGEGYPGGSTTLLSWAGAAGGGGAGGYGQNNKVDHAGGPGGPGVTYSIEGSSVLYARGGGGGTSTSTFSIPNTGQGGDGSYGNEAYGPRGTPYAGASGVVVVKYPITTASRQDTSVTSSKNITASFAINTYTVSATSSAGGSISPSSTSVTHGATTSFNLTSNSGYHIASVTGCGGTRSGNTYTTGGIVGDCTVSATFAIDTFNLLVYKEGTGTGSVTSSPAGINCGATCSAAYNLGTVVTLTATPDGDGNIFAGWSGACSGTSTCTVTMSAVRSVTATFNTIGVTVTPTSTTYYSARGANNTFGFSSSTTIGSTECRLLNSSSTALTSYAAGTSITYGMPATAGAYGYYIQCRNVSYPTKIATSSLITVNVVTVNVSATTTYNTTPGATVSFAYTPTTTAGSTECALLNNTQTALIAYQASSPINYTVPNSIGSYGYYIGCRHTVATSETGISSLVTVNTACATGTSWNGSICVTPTGTLSSSACTISAGNSTCQTSLTWNTLNPIGTSAVTTNYPSAGSTAGSGNSGSGVLYTIPYSPATTFYLYNNGGLLAQSTASASCASGTVWNAGDGKCQATTGTITATGCTITEGQNSCTSTISWQTLNPADTSVVKTSAGVQIASGNTGSTDRSISFGPNTFNLWNYGNIIASATGTAACSSLTEWNGSICELKAPEILTFTASQVNVVRGRSTTLMWESEPDATCTGTNFDTGGLYSGSVSVNPTVDTTYTLTCTRGSKTTIESISIRILDIAINEQ